MSDEELIPPSPTDADYRMEAEMQEAFAVHEDQGEVFTSDDPLELFSTWLKLANGHEMNDPNAMALATVDSSGMPDVRMVLLKDVDDGFVFYTNTTSAKGDHLANTPKAALCFHWKSIRRQVRVRGVAEFVTDDENDEYFSARSRGAQIGAWASQQSRPMAEDTILKTRVQDYESIYEDKDVPRPEFWRGYRLIPTSIEFWVNRPHRLHDRLLFENADGEGWTKTLLYP